MAFRVRGSAGDWSDGELRTLPVLPGRMYLSESRFRVLSNQDRETLTLTDLTANDPTRTFEELVVTLDAQLFYSALNALPYLHNYPYECTEQTLNRFLSTGILSSLYSNYPAIGRMAESLKERRSEFETFDDPGQPGDPNRKMLLEETPWLFASRGGHEANEADLLNTLDPETVKENQTSSLYRLQALQDDAGGFSWFEGGQTVPVDDALCARGLLESRRVRC